MSAQPINDLPGGHLWSDTQTALAAGHPLAPDQNDYETQEPFVGGDSSAIADHASLDPQIALVGDGISRSGHKPSTEPTPLSALSDLLLALCADALDDMERTRIANENRVRALRDAKGAEGSPEEQRMLALVDTLKAIEHGAELELKRTMRKHPFGPWVKATIGIGEKQGARLLAAIGDPYWHPVHDRPRTVSELWAYCGYHVLRTGQVATDTQSQVAGADPSSNAGQRSADTGQSDAGVAPTRKRGQQANWNADAKMRAFLCAEAAVKAGVRKGPAADDTAGYDTANRTAISPLGQVYLDGRDKYRAAVHQAECKRCGPAGKPAQVGSPLSLGHQHARAMRLVAKATLRDLWIEGKRLAGEAA